MDELKKSTLGIYHTAVAAAAKRSNRRSVDGAKGRRPSVQPLDQGQRTSSVGNGGPEKRGESPEPLIRGASGDVRKPLTAGFATGLNKGK